MIGAGQALIEHVTSDNHVIQIYLGLSIVSFVMTLVAFAKDYVKNCVAVFR